MFSPEEMEFLKIAQERGLLSESQVQEVLDNFFLLKEMDLEIGMEEIFLKKQFLSKRDIQAIHHIQGRPTAHLDKEEIPRELGGFERLEKIGYGSMGMVFKARQKKLDRMVALKVLLPHLAHQKDYVHLFLREVRVAGKLNHPNIVQAIDGGEDQGFYYFAMEYVEGETLANLLTRHHKISEERGIYITREIAFGLDHAFKHHVVHRDVKPGNIFLTKDGVPKLGDMGLAKPKGDLRLTKTDVFYGSPYYISPEQISSYSEVDIRSDIYSLGISLYEMVTGTVPYEGAPYPEVLNQHYRENIPSAKKDFPQIAHELDHLLQKMTRCKPEERYQTPLELVSALENLPNCQDFSPASQEKKTAKIVLSTAPPKPKGVCILLVEDDPDVQILTKTILQKKGYRITTASDGVDALMSMALHTFDLILADIVMPNMDGLKLLELKSKKGIDTPVLFLSSEDNEAVIARALELGAEGFLHKPISPTDLLAKIRQVLEG